MGAVDLLWKEPVTMVDGVFVIMLRMVDLMLSTTFNGM